MSRNAFILIASGITIGLLALLLANSGNPPNMGICVACFLRDTAGALKLHSTPTTQYLRPEILGIVFGAFVVALATREFKPEAGSSPFLRLALGFFMMIGCLVFLGCPLRMVLRIAGGDLNAIVGILGYIAGIGIGLFFLRRDFALPPRSPLPRSEGFGFPLIAFVLLLLFFFRGNIFAASQNGPGSLHAPSWISLAAALLIGGIVQRTRFCFVGMVSHVFLFRRFSMLMGVAALTATVFVGNLILHKVSFSFAAQPIAHSDSVWNFLAMMLVGLCGLLLGGCPLRQVAGAGQGNSDAAITVIGMLLGAAISHNFSLASSTAGTTSGGRITVLAGIAFAVAIAALNSRIMTRKTDAAM